LAACRLDPHGRSQKTAPIEKNCGKEQKVKEKVSSEQRFAVLDHAIKI
jgi:hypothetical protein